MLSQPLFGRRPSVIRFILRKSMQTLEKRMLEGKGGGGRGLVRFELITSQREATANECVARTGTVRDEQFIQLLVAVQLPAFNTDALSYDYIQPEFPLLCVSCCLNVTFICIVRTQSCLQFWVTLYRVTHNCHLYEVCESLDKTLLTA